MLTDTVQRIPAPHYAPVAIEVCIVTNLSISLSKAPLPVSVISVIAFGDKAELISLEKKKKKG